MTRRLWVNNFGPIAALLCAAGCSSSMAANDLAAPPDLGAPDLPAPGSLASSFGNNGIVTTTISGIVSGLVSQGASVVALGRSTPTNGYVLARFDAHGVLDPSFGSAGQVVNANIENPAMAADPTTARLVVAGTHVTGSTFLVSVSRYSKDGALDTTFGSSGALEFPFLANPNSTQIAAVAIDSGGDILVCGSAGDLATSASRMYLARIHAGALDPQFGTGGIASAAFGTDSPYPTAIVQQSGGKLVLAGGLQTQAGAATLALARFDASGMLDVSFGTAGEAREPLGPTGAAASAAALVSGDRIVVAGYTGVSASTWATARFTSNGSLDTTFGASGVARAQLGMPAQAAALAIDSLGRIIVAGLGNDAASNAAIAVVRYTMDGAADSSFGMGGQTLVDPSRLGGLGAQSIVIRPDGLIVVGGASGFPTSKMALAGVNP